ncbi:hypothetical protein OK074_0197 [Actinobacteria bacterium OK074]|nr:hypothetical protein OK074_0197 [Actinobacteria bacterium OK074]
MLSANVISGQVDYALGYTHNDLGPLRLHRPLIRATRVQTLAIGGTLMAGLSLLTGTLVMAGAVGPGMAQANLHIPRTGPSLGVAPVCVALPGDDRRAHHKGSATVFPPGPSPSFREDTTRETDRFSFDSLWVNLAV